MSLNQNSSMFFKHPKTLLELNITANGNLIDQVSEFNFLCININSLFAHIDTRPIEKLKHINWTTHTHKK